ncbi:26s proteasome regulatory subunit rpn2 psmd1 [Ceraceosorus bombacis]|uniref:26S proteasome regulatory subunit RPN2 n=1 Tax=Ceraceosorus bombacis TaxID=401625 RepID=A0A0P1BFX1_9BASI|nr:26s proteasome regulatory subunit rpn2 psmd1 [Ceraceosorus bombacis]
MPVPVTSAVGVLALLNEPEAELQTYALQKLNSLVPQFWAEIADSVSKIEILYEDAAHPSRQLAALVASKVYWNLGEFDEALSFALGADKLFDVESKDEYTDTIIAKAIDAYIEQRAAATGDAAQDDDKRLSSIVEQMFSRCIAEKEYKQALGIALETRRLDVIEKILSQVRESSLMQYTLGATIGFVQSLEVRTQVLHLLVKLFQSLPQPDHFSIAQCYVYLNAPQLASTLLHDLVHKAHTDAAASASANTENDPLLVAYQISFDLAESATQEFLETVRSDLQTRVAGAQPKIESSSAIAQADEDVEMGDAAAGTVSSATSAHTAEESTLASCIAQIRSILLGEESIQLYLDFLQRANNADLTILKAIKDTLDARNSVYHSAMTFANAFMHAGTTSDKFLRENLDWLAKASNWSKFTATAALGVINKGHLKESINLLNPYLPKDGSTGSVYSEGGSLFALGLIHANHGAEVLELLKDTLKNNPAEVVQHGAALGLGAAGMATGNEEVYEELRNVLYTDSAIAGEASGYAMGLVMLGTGSDRAVDEMLQYAHETQHEKIIRGLAIGLALICYGREDKADTVIDTLMSDKDAILRYGGIHAIALAYAGTGNNKAIRRLLHVAVSDVADDVRRAAVTSLGFLLFRNPTQVPRIVQLLSESYNPHVRYGSTLALGIACAGTGLDEALDLLQPMLKDPVDFVRQGAAVSLAMVLIQQNDTLNPRVASVRSAFEKTLTDKHEDAMAKFGAALAQGLIDAGGRNVTIGLQSRSGSSNMPAIVGMALFTQFWYWFPMAHFASLALTPTAVIGLNRDLKTPNFSFVCQARPSLFAYPAIIKKENEKKVEKVETAVLSTTAKAQARQRNKEREKQREERGESMDIDAKAPAKAAGDDGASKAEGKAAGSAKKERKPAEPAQFQVQNYSRVTPTQLKYVTFPADLRWQPIRPVTGLAARTGVDVHSTASVAPKGKLGVLGNLTPAPGASGTVTPSQAKGAPAAAAPAKTTLATGPSAEAARSIAASSSGGGGGGILLLVDRHPQEAFQQLRLDESSSEAPQQAPEQHQAQPGGSEISPEDAAAIARALSGEDEMDEDDQTGVQSSRRGDGSGGGGPGANQPGDGTAR